VTSWTSSVVAEALGIHDPGRCPFRSVSIDTRTLGPSDLFVALRGERFDGHDFLNAARQAGATGAVVARGTPPEDGLLFFEVDDTLHALGQLGRRRRADVSGPVVGVTGTNGKTVTKELAAAALATRWATHSTRANLNNEIGVPLTILAAPPETAALVVETGASVPGEIERLRRIIDPTAGIVTNVSAGHIEGFGSLANVMEEKVALLQDLPLAVVGMVPENLAARARQLAREVITAGVDARADCHPDSWQLAPDGRVILEFRGATLRLPLVGSHQAENAMLALALAEALGTSIDEVVRSMETVTLPGGRCQVLQSGDLTIVHDAYNANPSSVAAALETLKVLGAGRPLVILVGTMLELGADSPQAHEGVADLIVETEPDLVGAVGEFVPALERHRQRLRDRLVVAQDPDELGKVVAARLSGNEVVLLKASRGVRLERALAHLLPDREAPCSTTC